MKQRFLPLILPALSAIGAIYDIKPLLIGVLCFIPILVFGPFKPKNAWDYRILIYSIASSMLLSTTLISTQLTGSDIHLEMFFADQALKGGWEPSYAHAVNGALSVTVFIPTIAKLTGLELLTVFKVVTPLSFAVVPVILWETFRSFMTEKRAFLASFFFIVFPVFTLEITGIARQQIGEIFLALLIYFVVASNLKYSRRIPIIIGLGTLTIFSHYSLGIVLMLVLAVATVFYLIKRRWNSAKLAGITLATLGVISYGYFTAIASGQILYSVAYLVQSHLSMAGVGGLPIGPSISGPSSFIPMTSPFTQLISRGQLIVPALGLDIVSVSPVGKLYRVTQWILIGFTFIGFVKIVRHNLIPKMQGLMWGAIVILGACVIIPGFSTILNLSRFVHIGLFVLAPLPIILAKRKYIIAGVLTCYAILSSGVPFWAAHFEDTNQADVPYSIALSNQESDVGGRLTDNDAAVADWAYANNISTNLDIHSHLLFQERYGITDKLTVLLEVRKLQANEVELLKEWAQRDLMMIERREAITPKIRGYLLNWIETKRLTAAGKRPQIDKDSDIFTKFWLEDGEKVTIGEGTPISKDPTVFLKDWEPENRIVVYASKQWLPEDYVFLREWNTQNEKIAYWGGPGIRTNSSFDFIGLDKELESRPIVFRRGDAILYGPK